MFWRETFYLVSQAVIRHSFILGGLISFVCYLIVLSAYQHLPVALVSSLRETSILFAVLLGVLALKEKFTLDKVVLVILLVAGVAILYWAQVLVASGAG